MNVPWEMTFSNWAADNQYVCIIDEKNVFTFFISVAFLRFNVVFILSKLKKRSLKILSRRSKSTFETTETN